MANIDELQTTALQLSEADRASLVGTLIKSLVPDQDILSAWLDEAQRRDRELGIDPRAGVPAEDAFRRARAALK